MTHDSIDTKTLRQGHWKLLLRFQHFRHPWRSQGERNKLKTPFALSLSKGSLIPAARQRYKGFTLLELLIAISIFAIVGVLAMSGYNELLMQRERASETMARARTIQRAMTRLAQDFEQLEPRPVRDATAATPNPALYMGTLCAIEFTRAGWTNPAGVSRATLQRVCYRLENGKLLREYWNVLDRTLSSQPLQAVQVDKVTSFTLRFMDRNRQWQTRWPADSVPPLERNRALPLAVEFTLTLEDWGELKRIIEVVT